MPGPLEGLIMRMKVNVGWLAILGGVSGVLEEDIRRDRRGNGVYAV